MNRRQKGTRVSKPSPAAKTGLLTVLAVAFLALTATPVLAARGHVFKESFGTPGSGPGQLKEPSGLAVNEATDNVYVADNNNRIDKFDFALALSSETD